MAEGGALMMIYTLWRPTTLGGQAFSQPEGLFQLDNMNSTGNMQKKKTKKGILVYTNASTNPLTVECTYYKQMN